MSKKLNDVDLTKHIEKKSDYKKQLKKAQKELLLLQQSVFEKNIPCVFVFEGWDAAGKGGAIKRITQKIDPRGFQVHPIAAPTEEEHNYHYLHRFWNRLPSEGQIALFDRSWFGRVLVERVEGFASNKEWMRAYEEMNQFEKLLHDDGHLIHKFWFHISKDEQHKRFLERQQHYLKRWKITDEDWRNRNKWEEYEVAVEDMLQKTDTPYAPWDIIEGNDKWHARIKTLNIIIDKIKTHLIKSS
ncbi:polyphosphate kinase 2 family protein [Salipaludibacillus daqingensis]|uniref:polyphosphate kinase 2 family protein n=1 Tax=Salipaludibacillus daqingensis TaxID=3041001 RepID=UPI0024739A42|nr:UDP-galactose-lipid carrier transferase [Salipaludibacillus daqingensis]